MPSYLASTDPEEPIEIPGTGGRTVTFKACASYADEWELAEKAFQANGQAQPQTPTTRVYMQAKTVQMIIAWTLEDVDGAPLPVSIESLQKLTRPVGKWLEGEAAARFDGRPEEEEHPFVSGSLPPSAPA